MSRNEEVNLLLVKGVESWKWNKSPGLVPLSVK